LLVQVVEASLGLGGRSPVPGTSPVLLDKVARNAATVGTACGAAVVGCGVWASPAVTAKSVQKDINSRIRRH
jgi:hypothetical protein